MFDTLTTEEKVLGGGVLLGLGLLAFVKPARNAVGLADGGNKKYAIISNKKGTTQYELGWRNLSKTEARKILGGKNRASDSIWEYQIIKLK